MDYKSFNGPHLVKQFSGDEEILFEMITIFQDSYTDFLEPIRESIQVRDADKLKLNAHTFKGVLSNFYAEDGAMIAYELEIRGERGQFEDSHSLLIRLEAHIRLLLDELVHFKESLNKLA